MCYKKEITVNEDKRTVLCRFWDQSVRFSEKHRIPYLLTKERNLNVCFVVW
jgi:hypothetical protein